MGFLSFLSNICYRLTGQIAKAITLTLKPESAACARGGQRPSELKTLRRITATLKFCAKRSTKGFVYGNSLR
ncbi:MAG: hypothetical protein ACRDD9_21390, partial [Shewanella sp.]